MSRYDHQAADTDNPQAAHQDAGSGTPSTAADTGTESDIAAWLTNLRSTIRMDPWRAVAYLHRLTDPTIGTTPRPAHRADAIILTAETHARLRNTAAALVAARGGLRAARDLHPPTRGASPSRSACSPTSP